MLKNIKFGIKSFVIRKRPIKNNFLKNYQDNLVNFIYPQAYGKWNLWVSNKKHFNINLEIGFGMSNSIVENSKTYKNKKFIGIEVFFNGVVKTINALLNVEKNDNVIIFHSDCNAILKDYIEDNMLNTVVTLFPDPWPKRKQQKRRLFSFEILNLIHKKLKLGGIFYFKSDNLKYFYYVLNNIKYIKGFKLIDSKNFIKNFELEKTPYQIKAEKLNSKIYTICAEKIIIL